MLFIEVFLVLGLLSFVNATWLNRDNPWSQYCKTNNKSCEETDVFSNITHMDIKLNNYNINFGSDFQPLVDDLDGDGNMEMLLWNGVNLSLFSYNLIYLDGITSIGALVSNPAIVNYDSSDDYKEIIAIVNSLGVIYYKVIQWNGINFTTIQSITLTDGYTYSGISCTDFDNDSRDECFFRRSDGLIYSYDYASPINHLNIDISTYANGSSSPNTFIPYIKDYDGDGDLDVFFAYDFVAVAVDSAKNQQVWYHRKLSNHYRYPWWINSTIIDIKVSDLRNYGDTGKEVIIVGITRTGNTYPYNAYVWGGSPSNGTCYTSTTTNCPGSCCCGGDYISLLGVYEKNGSVVWQKGFAILSKGSIFSGGGEEHEILSNIHLFDYYGSGSKEFGVKHVSWERGKDPPRCINLFEKNYVFDGFNSTDVYCSDIVSGDTGKGEQTDAMCYAWETIDQISWADVNNDINHMKEWIGENKIITYDGEILFDFANYWKPNSNSGPYAEQNARNDNFIPVEVDGHLFLYASKPGKTIALYLDSPSYSNDLSMSEDDISFFKQNSNEVAISAIVHNKGDINQVEVEFIDTFQGNKVKNKTITLGYIRSGSSATATLLWNLTIGHTIYVFVDPNDKIEEIDEVNNYAKKEYIGLPKVYIEADVGLTKISREIENFIKNNLKFGFPVDDSDEADVLIAVARHNPLIVWYFVAVEEGWGYEGNMIKHQGKTEDKPYGAVIGSLNKGGKHHVYVTGNDIDGFIAGSKELIKQEDRFIEDEDSFLIDENNIDAIAVYDYLHTENNLPHYKKNTDEFANIVRKALNGEMYNYEDKSVTTNGIVLRLRHIDPAFSNNFVDYKDKIKLPVVLARGLWSNLSAWQTFGEELANKEGRDTWLIEITGGPYTECDSCPNYAFDDLTDSYVPTLLNGVLTFTGKDKLQYVGYSNGCRAVLSALEKGTFDPNKVETFVAVGCPGAFEGSSPFKTCYNKYGNFMLVELSDKTHLRSYDIGRTIRKYSKLDPSCWLLSSLLQGKDKISYNLANDYYKFISYTNDTQPGIGLNLDNFTIIHGYFPFRSSPSDMLVTINDANSIYENIIAINKTHFKVWGAHGGKDIPLLRSLADKKTTKNLVIKVINKELLSKSEVNEFLVNLT